MRCFNVVSFVYKYVYTCHELLLNFWLGLGISDGTSP